MQLCGSSEIDLSSEPTVAGTMVSFKWNLKQFCSRCNFSPLWIFFLVKNVLSICFLCNRFLGKLIMSCMRVIFSSLQW